MSHCKSASLNVQKRRKLETLERRITYLTQRIEDNVDTPGSLGWQSEELKALEFAVSTIRAHYSAPEGQKP